MPCSWCVCTIKGVVGDARMTSLLPSFPCGINVAALMEMGDWMVAGMLCCQEPGAADPPGGKRTVPAGIVEEP